MVAALLLVASCSHAPTPPSSPAPPSSSTPSAATALAGWELTLPVAGKKGDAETVKPAALTPPWLTTDPAGGLVFWAPVSGVTTTHSEHARTELDRLDGFTAGSGAVTMTASVTVTQLPSAVPEVIIGQIHGAGAISSVPFVLLSYESGRIMAVVKQAQTGEAHTDVPLLSDVPLGSRFDYTITDDGNGSLTVTATAGTRTATGTAQVPAAFVGASVRFQAGAYQQAPSATGGSGPDDGARVTFSAITVGPKAS